MGMPINTAFLEVTINEKGMRRVIFLHAKED